MLKMVDGTGIIGVDMVCPLGVSTPQPPNYDRVELEGAGMLVLPNSLDAPLERLELGGKTEQVSTRGVNLFDVSKVVFNSQVINNGNGSIKVIADESNNGFSANTPNTLKDYCPLLIAGQTYTLSANTAATTKQIYLKESGTVWTYGQSVQITKEMLDSVVLFYSDVNKTSIISNIQIEKGSTATAYEPYTGGKPSPSPEYPQEIKNSGKWNEETQKYEVDVKVTGKNLFDKDSVKKGYEFSSVASDMESPKEGWFVSDFISVTEGKVYISGKSTGGGCKLYNKDKLFVKNIQATSGQLTIEGGISYFRLNGETKDLNNIQVELGSAKTPYEPYRKLQTLTLTSDRPLTKWDRLVEHGGEIGWLYNSVNETIDGKTGKWSIQPASKIFYRTDITFPIVVPFCIELLGYDYSMGGYKKDTGITINNLGILCITLPEEVELTLDAYKQYLADNPLHVLYKGDSEEFIPLPQSEQNAIRALKTYYPTTVITADGGELDPDIKATYRKEI